MVTPMVKYFPYFFLVFFLFTNSSLVAQNSALDSLKNAYEKAQDNEAKLDLMHQMIRSYAMLDPQLALKYAFNFDSIATLMNKPEWLAKAKNNLGLSHYTSAKYDQAIDYFLQALPISESIQDTFYMGILNVNIGVCNFRRQRSEEAIKYYKKGLEYFIPIQDSTWIGKTYNNIASMYFKESQIDSAAHYYQKALQILTVTGDQSGIRQVYSNLGAIFFQKEEFNKSAEAHRQALKLTNPNEDASMYSRIESNLGHALIQTGNFNEAKIHLDTALNIANRQGLLDQQVQALNNLSEWYEKTGQFKPALEHWQKSVTIKDSIFNQEKNAAMQEMLTKYETEKKEAENEYLLAQNQVKDLQLKNVRRQRSFFILGLIALGIILGVIFYAYQTKQKSNRKLAEKNDIISKALAEKEVLLREIHHRVKNNLQVISSLLSLQSRRVRDEATATAILESRNRVKAMALIHQNLYREDNLTGVDASAYISKLVENLFETYNVNANQITFEKDIQPLNVDIDTIIPFGLIINELISNALKYAFPHGTSGKIKVQLKEEHGKLALQVEDNGVGLPEGFNLQKLNSFGYKLIHVFSKKMQGVLDVQSQQGTRVRLVAPV